MTTVNGKFEGGKLDANWAIDNNSNRAYGPVLPTSGTLGALGTVGAIRYALHSSWNVAGLPGPIMCGEVNLNGNSNPYLGFYYAYSDKGNGTIDANYGGTAPTIKTEVSEDCGVNWTTVNTITCKETGKPTVAGNWYIPTSAEYQGVAFTLPTYANKSILVKVTGTPGSNGNALYVDEIHMLQATEVNDIIATTGNMNIYPNPAVNNPFIGSASSLIPKFL